MVKVGKFVLFFFLILSCTVLRVKSESSNVDFMEIYYSEIQNAETDILGGSYDKALDYYILANNTRSLFTDDALNAVLCATFSNRFVDALPFVKNLVQKGVPISYFEKKYLYRPLVLSQEWKDFSLSDVKPTFNITLRNELDSMLTMDQLFRENYDENRDTILKIDESNRLEMLQIFDKYGYVGDELYGVKMKGDTTIRRDQATITALLIHQVKNHPVVFASLLENFVLKGEMKNSSYVYHSKNFLQLEKYRYSCLQMAQALFVQVQNELYTCCCEDANMIDRNRKRIYLEPLASLKKKTQFYYESDTPFLLTKGTVAKYSIYYLDGYNKFKKELIEKGFVLFDKLDSDESYAKKRFRNE